MRFMRVALPVVEATSASAGRLMTAAFLALLTSTLPNSGIAQDHPHCDEANGFLTRELDMVTRIDPDTLDDWRTDRRLAACRITAAGTRTLSLGATARRFYERIRETGWTRTPDPRDAPNEASLRFRMEQTDCLFNVYEGILLGTDSEIAVTEAIEQQSNLPVYHVLVLCVPALPAKPRS